MKIEHKVFSENSETSPDFIIGGAMKSGTTSLHQILAKHPDIAMAKDEIGFFDLDNLLEHSDFGFFNEKTKQWTYQKFDKSQNLKNWYNSKLEPSKSNYMLLGEDSTTYLASPIAAERIGKLRKKIKLIFILRHPTSRAISNYFHLVKSGRAEYNLEDTIQFYPHSILRRGLYKTQLEFYYRHIPKEQIKIILFEDFKEDPKKEIEKICKFLEIDKDKFRDEDFKNHSNLTLYPRYFKIQLIYNRFSRNMGKKRYANFLPIKTNLKAQELSFTQKLFKKIHQKINPKSAKFKPKVNESTKLYLDDFFKAELRGIDELTGQQIFNRWFKT